VKTWVDAVKQYRVYGMHDVDTSTCSNRHHPQPISYGRLTWASPMTICSQGENGEQRRLQIRAKSLGTMLVMLVRLLTSIPTQN
jgi:hypothetical protein